MSVTNIVEKVAFGEPIFRSGSVWDGTYVLYKVPRKKTLYVTLIVINRLDGSALFQISSSGNALSIGTQGVFEFKNPIKLTQGSSISLYSPGNGSGIFGGFYGYLE